MKTGTKKLLSLILSTALTVNAGLMMFKTNVLANIPFISTSGDTVTLTNQLEDGDLGGLAEFKIEDNDGLKISYYDSNAGETKSFDLEQGKSFILNANCGLIVNTDYTFDSVTLNGGSGYVNRAMLKNNSTVTITGSVSGSGDNEIVNYGNYIIDTFSTDDMGAFKNGYMKTRELLDGSTETTIEGTGTIIANGVYIGSSEVYSDAPGSEIIVTEHFTYIPTDTLNATVIAKKNTEINTMGGEFTLLVGNASTTISTMEIEKSAEDFFLNPETILNSIPDVVYGTEYDFSDYVSVVSGYDSSKIYFEYSSDLSDITEDQPTAVGYHYVRAIAPSYGSYVEQESAWQAYKIDYLSMKSLFPPSGTPIVTITGLVNEVYIPDALVLTPPEGILIAFPSSPNEDLAGFSASASLSVEDIYFDGDISNNVNQDLGVAFADDSTGATTAEISIIDLVPEIEDYVFDPYDPEFEASLIIDEDEYETSLEGIVEADELYISIYDENLSSVELTVDGEKSDCPIEEVGCDITLESITGKSQTVKITATDMADRTSEVEFTLVKPLEPITVTLEDMPDDVFYGQDLSKAFEGITIAVDPEDYAGEPYLEYSTDGEIFSTTEPTDSTFYVRAVAPATTIYSEGVSEAVEYSRRYLLGSDISETGTLYTLTGMTNGRYVTDSVTIVAPEHFLIATNKTGIDNYSQSIIITDEGILSGDLSELSTFQIFFKRDDGALSQAITYSSSSGTDPNFQNLILDKNDPSISAVADGSSVTVTDGCNITADSLKITVSDSNLDSAVINGTECTINYGIASVTLESTPLADPEEITVYAIDLAGREVEMSFTLSHTPIDPEKAEVLIEDVYYGEDYAPEIDTDSDGEVTFYYRDNSKGDDSPYLEGKPTVPGDYTVVAEIEATDNYNEATCSATFSILKAIPVITFDIPDEIYAGEDYVIGVETNSDAEVFKRFYYNDGGMRDTVFETEPKSMGEYIVTVTLQETDLYEYATESKEFTVEGKTFTPGVTVEDCFAGETPVPVLTGVPEDYTGTIVYETRINGDVETEFAEGLPTVTGNYTLRVTFPSTNVYYGTTCTADFSITKRSVQATVSVADIYVGGTVTPVLTLIDPEEYEYIDETIYQYKESAAPDSEYSETVPSAAGEYTVRALIQPSDVYNGGSCTDTFTISKYATEAFVTVDDITFGDTVSPVLTIDPESYDNTENISFEYRLSTDPEAEYSFDVPTDAGTYSLLVTVPATAKYEGTTCEAEFTIEKKQITASVSVEDITYGDEISPVVTTDPEEYDGDVKDYVFEYKLSTDEDTEYSETVPVSAGTYTVRVTLPDTDNYKGTTCFGSFTIGKSDVTATVSVADIYVGETPDPKVTCISGGTATFEYKLSADSDSAYSGTVPTAAGEYTVRATVAETTNYLSTTCEDTFTISKYEVTAEVTAADIYVGGDVAPKITIDPEEYDGEVKVEYIADGDTEYSTEVPSAAGSYTVRVTLPETDKYLGTSCEDTFSIDKNVVTATVSVADIHVGETPAPEVTTVSKGQVTFEYKLSTDSDEEYSETVPSAAGEYKVRATVAETDKYLSTTCENTFEILKYEVIAEVSVEDILVGGDVDPEITIDPEEYNGEVIVEYIGDGDAEYSTEAPSAAGSYTVIVTLPETDKYLGTSCEDTFTIGKNAVTATVSVADILVGGDVDPEITIDPEEYDGEVTVAYIADGDTEYSTEVPSAAGSYTVIVTLPETDKYLGTSCEDTFTISKNAVTATVSVADILVGGDVDPEITIDPEEYDGEVTVEYIGDGDTEYSTEAPSAAGSYTVRVTLPETDKYLGTTCEDTFTISRDEITATVSVADIYVGETPSPVVTTASKGQVTIEYKPGTAPDTEYSETVPTAAGEYKVRATIAETDEYLSTTCEDTFSILKYEVTAEVSVADILAGDDVDPEITVDPKEYDGDIKVEYIGEGDTEYTTKVPTAAGSYTVRVTLPETDAYLGTICTDTFTISKREAVATVSVADIYVGENVNPVVTTNSNGEPRIEYSLSSENKFTFKVPTAAGTYTVRVTLPETDKYLGTTCEDTFTISKYEVTAEVKASDIYVGGDVAPSITVDPVGYDGEIKVEYAITGDTKYSTEVPSAAGSYTVRVTLPETEKYLGTTCEDTFVISKNAVTATVSVADIHVGEKVDPKVTTVSKGQVTFEYKLSTAEDSAYSVTVPSAAGEYTVRATVAETDKYLSTTCTATFTISKYEITAKVTAANIYVGGNVAPSITVDPVGYDGEIKVEYAVAGGTEYSTEVPSAAGSYTVRVTLFETEKYLGTTCENTFTISKNAVTATVSVKDIYVGEEVDPKVTTVSRGRVTIEYKPSTAPDTSYSETVPSAAGEYTVRATVAETAEYLSTACTASFRISKRTASATVSVEDITVGGTVTPVVSVVSDGEVTVEYKLSTDPDTEYSETAPSVAGVYNVRVTVEETEKYTGASSTNTFTISKNVTTASVSVADIYVGGKVTPVVTTASNGKNETTFEYKLSTADDSTYSATVPSSAGTYTVRATVPATVEYARIVCTAEFKIMLNPVTKLVLTVPDIYYGQTVKPEYETDSNGDVTIMYKLSGSDDYSITPPVAVGKYTAIAITAETAQFESASVTTEFSISYLENPQTAYVPSGTAGDNGYYTSDVDLKAPDGYLISATPDGEFKDSIPYTEDLNVIYLKRIEDNALTAAITLADKPKIDKEAPVFNGTAGAVLEDAVLFEESLVVVVGDKNLTSLTVNGELIDLNVSGANILTLTRPEDGYMSYHIVAVDVAGNVSTLDISLLADWLKERIIPAGRALPLTTGEMYFLDVGEWIVTIVNSDGTETESKTVFSGNMPFYVNSDAQYIFKKVT